MFKGISGSSSLPENLLESIHPGMGPYGGPPLRVVISYGGIRVAVEEFDKTFKDSLFSIILVDYK